MKTSIFRLRISDVARWFRGDRRVQTDVLDKIERHFHRSARPAVYLGAVALDIGYSLSQTEEMLAKLIEAGIVRALDAAEISALGLDCRAAVFRLVGEPDPMKAGD